MENFNFKKKMRDICVYDFFKYDVYSISCESKNRKAKL